MCCSFIKAHSRSTITSKQYRFHKHAWKLLDLKKKVPRVRPLNRSAAKSTHLFEFKVRISFLQVWVCLVAKGSVARWVGCSGKVEDKLGSRLGTGHWAGLLYLQQAGQARTKAQHTTSAHQPVPPTKNAARNNTMMFTCWGIIRGVFCHWLTQENSI